MYNKKTIKDNSQDHLIWVTMKLIFSWYLHFNEKLFAPKLILGVDGPDFWWYDAVDYI